jgi:4,5-dihydroxyphthalate decarboxylase
MRYDIMQPLLEGRVEIPGVTLKPAAGPGGTIIGKDSPIPTGDFGLVDLNLGNLLPGIEAGWEIVALPVFSKRKHVYTYIFCRADAGIRTPKDLEGKRIGTGRYRSAITIWIRGLLRDRYGVDLSKVSWVVNGSDPFPIYDASAKIAKIEKQNIVDGLFDGDFDVLMTDISDARLFDRLENSPEITRLFPNYHDEDRRLYEDTGIFTPVHVIAMSKKLDREHPDLAGTLFMAFEKAKQTAYGDILSDMRGFGLLYLREAFKAQQAEWGDPFRYGITANKRAIDMFFQYNVDQGMCERNHAYDEVFAGSTLDT